MEIEMSCKQSFVSTDSSVQNILLKIRQDFKVFLFPFAQFQNTCVKNYFLVMRINTRLCPHKILKCFKCFLISYNSNSEVNRQIEKQLVYKVLCTKYQVLFYLVVIKCVVELFKTPNILIQILEQSPILTQIKKIYRRSDHQPKLKVFSFRGETFRSLLVACYLLLVARCFSLVARYFLLVASYFLLVIRQEVLKDFSFSQSKQKVLHINLYKMFNL